MMKILLADDFALLREDLCETLGAQPDMEVVGAAESGAQVQEMAQKLDFDVLLIDIEMENTTAGIHAAENILAEKPDAIVIFLTAHETENMILMSMGAGAVDYVVKGCPDEELLEHIRKSLRRRTDARRAGAAYGAQGVFPPAPLGKEPAVFHQQRIPADARGAEPCALSARRNEGEGYCGRAVR
ncbi:MAG: response regulator transcription factor [Christensenellales bacterium]